ncbi:aspartate/glutamate racemase family protein [Veronia pacifica]|uniref:Hydantoin racemase n=1 Tax=Veronia pacifica TaxID=1080227 RepID=A0A1C3EIM7_9GAMM|nr:aspartate/glutamate racemase family protein [Veronia pacifica]ODA33083.1 hydantoin racemase [Veronia pacifica]
MIDIINPNGSSSMTQQLADSLNNTGVTTQRLRFHYCKDAPLSIEGFEDGVRAAYYLTKLIKQRDERDNPAEGYVIACFDDTGVDAAREITARPVIGIGEASMKVATYLGSSFVVMTTLQRSVSIIERNVMLYGLQSHCSGVIASNIPVLSLDTEPDAYDLIVRKARRALASSFGEVLVLGCAGMSHWQKRLQSELGLPVVDGVQVAIALINAFSNIGLSTSKVCSYAYPEKKQPFTDDK